MYVGRCVPTVRGALRVFIFPLIFAVGRGLGVVEVGGSSPRNYLRFQIVPVCINEGRDRGVWGGRIERLLGGASP